MTAASRCCLLRDLNVLTTMRAASILYAPEPPLTPNGERVKRRAPGGSVLICREGPAFQSSVLHRSFQSRE